MPPLALISHVSEPLPKGQPVVATCTQPPDSSIPACHHQLRSSPIPSSVGAAHRRTTRSDCRQRNSSGVITLVA